MKTFFTIINLLGLQLGSLKATIISIIGGNTNASAVEHSAPINEMNRLKLGTHSAMITGRGEIVSTRWYGVQAIQTYK